MNTINLTPPGFNTKIMLLCAIKAHIYLYNMIELTQYMIQSFPLPEKKTNEILYGTKLLYIGQGI